MTDTFVVDRAGAFVVGKAQTTPEDEALGFMASTATRSIQGLDVDAAMPAVVSGICSAPPCSTACSSARGAAWA
jgi:hypothetical protein